MDSYKQLQKELKRLSLELGQSLKVKLNAKKHLLDEEYERLMKFKQPRKQMIKLALKKTGDQHIMEFEYNKIKRFFESIPVGSIIYPTELESDSFIHSNPSMSASKLIFQLPYDEELDFLQIRIVTPSQSNTIQSKRAPQAYRFGNNNCLFSPIQKAIEEKIDKAQNNQTKRKYKSLLNKMNQLADEFENLGATEDLIQKLCDLVNLKIVIHQIIKSQNTSLVYKSSVSQMCQFEFEFINVRLNHVDLWLPLDNNNEYILDQQQMNDLATELKQKNETFVFSRSSKTDYRKIQQGERLYIEKEYNECCKQETLLNQDQRDLVLTLNKNERDFVMQFMNHNGNVLFQSLENIQTDLLKHIDITKGYTQHLTIDERYRRGFPYITDFRKVSSNQFCLEYNGYYMVQVNWDNAPLFIQKILKNEFHKYYFFITPVLQFLTDHNVQWNPICGMYGKHSRMINYTPEQLQKYNGKAPYFLQPAKNMNDKERYLKLNVYSPEEDIISILAKDKTIVKNPYESYTYQLLIEREQQNQQQTLQHISASILQYQTLNLLVQLSKMDINKIAGVVGDDIYFYDHDFITEPMFRSKEENKFDKIQWQTDNFINNPFHWCTKDDYDCGDEQPEYHQYELHLGQGGRGKSYQKHMDKGIINKIYVTLTNQLVTDQQNQYGTKCYTCASFTSKIEKKKINPSTSIIIDELGLVGSEFIKYIKSKIPQARVYCLGDDLQLVLNQGDQFNPSNYDKVYTEEYYSTDFRATGKLVQLKDNIRAAMRQVMSEIDIFHNILKPVLKSKNNYQLQQLYCIQDMITTCSNNKKDKYTDLLQHKGNKYRVVKTQVIKGIKYNCGDILYDVPQDSKAFAKQHAYTCHSLQGQTFKNRLFISQPIHSSDPEIQKLFKEYCYTAVSRCKNIDQLYILSQY